MAKKPSHGPSVKTRRQTYEIEGHRYTLTLAKVALRKMDLRTPDPIETACTRILRQAGHDVVALEVHHHGVTCELRDGTLREFPFSESAIKFVHKFTVAMQTLQNLGEFSIDIEGYSKS